ncbi:hypothetical protein NGRA_2217 [Nosema granulosis]|uniref:Uncharacterized protein n=1 Tax=Nosema granulosis TaxID=83296 RepID=A0A9P6KXX5_9MICR|nr:hypothetical protein NGRA_2217 [Nosema granulosis]
MDNELYKLPSNTFIWNFRTNIHKNQRQNTRMLHVDTTFKIGGEGVEIQIDETAIFNIKIIINPSSIYDSYPNIQWLIGGIESNKRKNFFLELIPNRKLQLFMT